MSDLKKEEIEQHIISVVHSMFDDSGFTIETINESTLVKLFELRGTPIRYEKSLRDIERDFRIYLEDMKEFKNERV